ncbi:nucleotidyl transferase AbiEii/AbiGii toxin family protein [Skermania sp. ID1734]|uniref:nucleotidyl transferase AbiEii/AbiGii toxin family protein n=1 Tax=Skermania sp. ID1734 TaxID=2597516 RepID=UPI00117C8C1D|nr:nucleotidyl transferase AbiEii/AbiGii toxin family protein [Skermania sp. ID1734]TSE01839.1 nucleotidyl transferase AbiEii/AbiGii toxin family protein [Skermania sp. ID1734]
MSQLPAELRTLLPESTMSTWVKVAPLVPANGYLVGGTALTVHLLHRVSRDLDFFIPEPFDPESLLDTLSGAGSFTPTFLDEGTLNGILDETKVQFLDATTQHLLAPVQEIGGIQVASLQDVFATKLKVIADRGELRDYFDLMIVEQKTDLRAEQGLEFFLERYRPRVPQQAVARIVLGLGFMDDVADDPTLPAKREQIEAYWQRRQPDIARNWP